MIMPTHDLFVPLRTSQHGVPDGAFDAAKIALALFWWA